jgi:uncharacterized coiled-coil DUF342 family protein
MKSEYAVAFLVLLLPLASCERKEPSESRTSPASQPRSSQSAAKSENGKDVKRDAPEIADNSRESLADTKDRFIASMQSKLRDLDHEIAQLKGKTAGLNETARIEADRWVNALNEKRSDLNQQMEALKQASKEKWEEVRSALETAFSELQKSYENTKSKLSG